MLQVSDKVPGSSGWKQWTKQDDGSQPGHCDCTEPSVAVTGGCYWEHVDKLGVRAICPLLISSCDTCIRLLSRILFYHLVVCGHVCWSDEWVSRKLNVMLHNIFALPAEVFSSCLTIISAVMVGGLFLWPALRYGTGYQTVWEIRPSAETPSSVHWRRFYFQLTCVHSALELSGRCALQIYLLRSFLRRAFLASLERSVDFIDDDDGDWWC